MTGLLKVGPTYIPLHITLLSGSIIFFILIQLLPTIKMSIIMGIVLTTKEVHKSFFNRKAAATTSHGLRLRTKKS